MYYIFQSDKQCSVKCERKDEIPGIEYIMAYMFLDNAIKGAEEIALRSKHTKIVDGDGNEHVYLYTISGGVLLQLNPKPDFLEFAAAFRQLGFKVGLQGMWSEVKAPGVHYRPNLHKIILDSLLHRINERLA